jgi:hypothetical protein
MANINVLLKQWALIKFLVVSDGKLISINEHLFTVHGEETVDVCAVQQLARWNAEAETGGGEHNEILWNNHSHTVEWVTTSPVLYQFSHKYGWLILHYMHW